MLVIILSIKILIAAVFLVFGYGVLLIAKEVRRNGKYSMLIYVFEGLLFMPFSYAVYFKLRKNNAIRCGKDNDIETEKYLANYKISVVLGCIAYLMLIAAIVGWAIKA